MKKIVSILLVAVILTLALTSCSMFTTDEKVSIYDIVNNSSATSITTQVRYVPSTGDEFTGWYIVQREDNNMIVDYEFNRYTTVEESVAAGTADRITNEKGVVYYIDGAYYTSGDETKTPWVGSPIDLDFKFNITKDKLINVFNPTENTVYADITPENCLEVFGIDFGAEGNIKIMFETNGVQLIELELSYITKSGADVGITSTYSYNDLTLDFSEILGEETEGEGAE